MSFAHLRDEITWGRYVGPSLPASLQCLLNPPGPNPTPTSDDAITRNPGRAPGSDRIPGRATGSDRRDGDQVPNLRPIQRLRLLPSENTRGVLRNTPLPTINGSVFCKRFHLGMVCFAGCPRAASHVHPAIDVVDAVASALTAERAANANA